MMSSEVEVGSSPLSRVLFLSVNGEPMRFFLRPGPAKAQFQPIIRAGGGVVCRVQKPGAILLSDPEDMAKVPASAAHHYVSTQYVRDCVERNQQLEVEDYRFRGESEQTRSPKRKRERSGGRVGYTAEEDAAILCYMRGRAQEVRGNRVWQRMEQEVVTSHSWQSMKDRYRKFLTKQQQEEPLEEDGGGREKAGVKDGPLDKLFVKPVREKEPAQSVHEKDPPPPSPEKANANRSLERTDSQSSAEPIHPQLSPERPSPRHTPAKTHPQPSAEPARSQPSPDRPHPQHTPVKTHPQPSAEPPRPQPSPDRPHPQHTPTKTHPQPSTSKMPSQPPLKQKGPQPTPEITASPERTTPAPSLDKIHPQALSASVQSHSLAGEGNSVEREVAGPSCLSPGRNEQLVVTEEVEKEEQVSARKKRKLCILERAVKEFQDSDESDDDTPDMAFSRTTQSADPKDLGKGIPPTGVTQEGDDNHDNENGNRDREARSAAQPEAPHVQRGAAARSAGREDRGPGQRGSARLTSNVHMFLFDREPQGEEPSQPARDTPFSQAQLKEAKRQLRDLMTRSKQGLVSVTKSLLKTSGDAPAALQCLLTGRGPPGATLWDPRDDRLLLSGDPSQRKLHEKYGKVSVAKRIAFLNAE